jgi:hypothetical protein
MGVIPARDPGPGKAKPRSGELNTQKVERRKGMTARKRKGLVPPVSERHHRSVLGEVDERKGVFIRTGVVNERTGPRGSLTQLKRDIRMSQTRITVNQFRINEEQCDSTKEVGQFTFEILSLLSNNLDRQQ